MPLEVTGHTSPDDAKVIRKWLGGQVGKAESTETNLH